MAKLQLSGKAGSYTLKIGGVDISKYCKSISITIVSPSPPLVNISLIPDDIDVDIDNIEYFIDQKSEFHIKMNALDRVSK